MFSPQDYELAARILGLPVPITAAEQAAAAPMTAVVMRTFCQTLPPAPGMEDEHMMNMGATRSLNAPPDNTQPVYRNQLQHRLQAGVTDPHHEQEILDLIDLITNNPITKLTETHNNNLLNKVKNTFNETEQQLFIASFYSYLNYHKTDDYIVDLDNIWKWLCFNQKFNAIRILEKNFEV